MDVTHPGVGECTTDLYRTLQVDPSAHSAVIKAAYRALIRMAHPDVGGDTRAAQSLTQAYSILTDSESRQRYDCIRTRSPVGKGHGALRRPGVTAPAERLAALLSPQLQPMEGGKLARCFDLAGRLPGAGDHRMWVKVLRDSDQASATAFRALTEAGRLCRGLWEWGSDLFVALVPRWSAALAELPRGPLGPWPRLGSAIVVLDARTGLIHHQGRTNELPTYSVAARAFREVTLGSGQRKAS
ncbi:MAG: J domain-containing protein [Candidatus Methylomirabilia bacterium]